MELECKRDDRAACWRILDANLRFWAWNSFAVRHGVDYPVGYYETALGRSWSPRPVSRPPRYHWRLYACSPYSPDLWAVYSLWRLGRMKPSAIVRSWLGLVGSALRSPGSISFDFGEWRDARPRLTILGRMVKDVMRTLFYHNPSRSSSSRTSSATDRFARGP
jgi:hypothetical protein